MRRFCTIFIVFSCLFFAFNAQATCYIVDHDPDREHTDLVLFGGGVELYLQGQLFKLKYPIQMVSFGKNIEKGQEPIPLTMGDVRRIFVETPEVIPSNDQLIKCGVPATAL